MAPSRAVTRRVAIQIAAAQRSISLAESSPLHRPSFPRPSVSRILPAIFTSAPVRRWNSSTSSSQGVEAPDYLDERELKIFNTLKQELQPIKLEVQDVSGGCGSMYALDIVSAKFKGLSVIKQHRLVNSVLGDEIKKWHGVQLKTKAP